MSGVVGKTLAASSWVAFLIGLVWTGRIDDVVELDPIPVSLTVVRAFGDEVVSVTPKADGSAPLSLAVAALDEAATWLADSNSAPDLVVRLTDESGRGDLWTLRRGDLAARGTSVRDGRGFFIWAVGRVEVEAGETLDLRLVVEGADREFLGFSPRIHCGTDESGELPKIRRKEKSPGIVLLGGAMGVFVHLFLLVIRLIVPWRQALPPEDGF